MPQMPIEIVTIGQGIFYEGMLYKVVDIHRIEYQRLRISLENILNGSLRSINLNPLAAVPVVPKYMMRVIGTEYEYDELIMEAEAWRNNSFTRYDGRRCYPSEGA